MLLLVPGVQRRHIVSLSVSLPVCLSVCLSVPCSLSKRVYAMQRPSQNVCVCLSVCSLSKSACVVLRIACSSACLSVCLSVSLSVCCSQSKRVCVAQRPSHRLLAAFLSVCLLFTEQEGVYRIESVTLPVYLPICLSFCLSPCLSVCYSLS